MNVGGQFVTSDSETATSRRIEPVQVCVGRDVPRQHVARVAFSVIDGSSKTMPISEEQCAGRLPQPACAALIEDAADEAAAAGITGDEEPPVRVRVPQRREDRERVVERRGIRELGRQPVVGDEDLAARRVASRAMKTEYMFGEVPMYPPPWRYSIFSAGVVWRGRNHRPGTPATVSRSVETCSACTHGGNTVPATASSAFSIERNSSTGSEVSVTEERPSQLASHADADVASDAAGAAPRLPERDAEERRPHRFGQAEEVDRRDRRGCGGDFGPVRHHHGVRLSCAT